MVEGLYSLNNYLLNIFKKYNLNEEVEFNYSQHKNFDIQCNNLVKHSNHKDIESIKKDIVKDIESIKEISRCELSSNNFINFELSNNYFTYMLNDFSISKKSESILLDYGGPNIGKALHVGHLRTLNIGRSLYRINKLIGNKVISDIHLGDWGMPISLIIAFLNKNNIDITKIEYKDLESIYPEAVILSQNDEAFYDEAKKISQNLNNKVGDAFEKWKIIYSISVNEIKSLLNKLNHQFDWFYGESDVIEEVQIVLDQALANNKLKVDDGATVSSEISDPPIILIKSDGSFLYITTDLGTVYFRESKKEFDKYLYIVDQRQAEHFKQLFSTVKHFGLSSNTFVHIGYGTVNGKDKKPLKTRDGGTYKLEDLYNDVFNFLRKRNSNEQNLNTLTNSVLTYSDLLPNRKVNYEFDIERFTDINGKTAVYLQYSQVRAKKLIGNSTNISFNKMGNLNDNERELCLMVSKFHYYFYNSFNNDEPHHLAEYAYSLCRVFNTFYSNNKIFTDDISEEERNKKLWIVQKFYETLVNVFYCLGIEPVSEM